MKWDTVKEVLYKALALEPAERGAFLEERCGKDADLLAEVRSLLAAHDDEPEFLETPALDRAELAGSRAGERLGAFELERPIGFGGMGVVYSARRTDEYEQRVAIKLLRTERGLLEPRRAEELDRRFRSERQTLAGLDHPNIARLFDGGTAADGTPYLVMEYVDGLPIDRYCAARGLSTQERLELFQTVCGAVQYAHRHLVVHRDLKPGNILTTTEGAPKLVDFGIAKLLEPDAGIATRTRTPLMTPEYASPEQIRGESVSTASDVYSLGVVLYELLAGRRPHELGDVPHHEALRILCEEEPEKPSTAAARRTQPDGAPLRRLKGDLDAIVLKALHKDPLRRYGSVEELSLDLRRYVAGLPVGARPDSLGYRAARFVQRHSLAVTAAALAFVALSAATTIAVLSAREARAQRDTARDAQREANAQAERAREIADYLVDVFRTADPYGGSIGLEPRGLEITAGEILRHGVDLVATDLAGEPELQAHLRHVLGDVYAGLGALGEAEALLERALETRRKLFGGEHLDVAATLQRLGELSILKGDFARAEPQLLEAARIRRRLVGERHVKVAESSAALGTLYRFLRDDERAQRYYDEALALHAELLPSDHPAVALGLAQQAQMLQIGGRPADAEPIYRDALELLIAAHGEAHAHTANVMDELGKLLVTRGELEEAERWAERAYEARRTVFGDEHPEVAASLMSRGHVLVARHDYDGALPFYEEALGIQRAMLPGDHPTIASTLNNLAYLFAMKRDYTRAEPLLREALAIDREHFPAGHPSLATMVHNLAAIAMDRKEYGEAEALYREALAARRAALGERHPSTAESLSGLGALFSRLGRLEEAEPLLCEAYAIRREVLGEGHESVANTASLLGPLLRDTGRLDEAEPILRSMLETARRRLAPDNPFVAGALTDLGMLLTLAGRPEEAEPLLREAYEISRPYLRTHAHTARTTAALGACSTNLGRYEEAEALLTQSHAVLERASGPDDRETQRTVKWLVELYEAWGRRADAEAWRERLVGAEGDE